MSVSLSKTTAKSVRPVNADEVRAWCIRKGVSVSPHGRLNQSAVDRFNAAHRLARKMYVPAAPRATRVLTLDGRKADRAGRNRRITVTATPAQVRKWAFAAGFPVGTRGRLSPEVMDAYANREANLARR
jgi:hypothetical protein